MQCASFFFLRILHVRLLLLRPNVFASARSSLTPYFPNQSSSRSEMALRTEVSTLCVQTAVTAIEILDANLHSKSRLFSAIAVFVTLSAATVIIAASLVAKLDVSFEKDNNVYGDVVATAIQVLDEHR